MEAMSGSVDAVVSVPSQSSNSRSGRAGWVAISIISISMNDCLAVEASVGRSGFTGGNSGITTFSPRWNTTLNKYEKRLKSQGDTGVDR